MTTTPLAGLPEYPALYQTVPATVARRVLAGALSGVLVGGLAAAGGYLLARFAPVGPVSGWPLLSVGLAVVLALVAAVWSALAGGWLPQLVLGLRSVRVADGRRPGWAGFGRAVLLGLAAAVSLGLVPLLTTLLTRDASGRAWPDRLTGLAVLDVRRGRNVLSRPVKQHELVEAFRVLPDRPAIIQVRPSGTVVAASAPAARVSAPAGPAMPMPAPASVPTGAETTRVSAPVGSTPRPVVEPAAGSGAPTAGAVWRLTFDTGQSLLLHGSALLGRGPAARASFRGADLLRVEDPSHTVSGTHLAITGNDLGVWVEDLGSTNGSEVIAPNGSAKVLVPRMRTGVARGARVRLGDRLMTVERAQ